MVPSIDLLTAANQHRAAILDLEPVVCSISAVSETIRDQMGSVVFVGPQGVRLPSGVQCQAGAPTERI